MKMYNYGISHNNIEPSLGKALSWAGFNVYMKGKRQMNNGLTDHNQVIFFDAGGVLFDTFTKKEERITKLLSARGLPKDRIKAAIDKANHEIIGLFDVQQVISTWEEEQHYFKSYYSIIAEALQQTELTEELFYCTHYAAHCELFPEVRGVLEGLSVKYRLGVISNAMSSMNWVFDRLDIRKYFEAIILSSTVEASKPSEKIYHYALDQMRITPSQSLFIDDLHENILGAEQVGIHAFHLKRNQMDLLKLLKQIQVL